MTFTQIRLVV